MAVTDKSWDGSASRWDSAISYCAACLIDTNTGMKSKSGCSLPVREPTGEINRNAVAAAAAALNGARGASIDPKDRQVAARALVKIYHQDLNEAPPDTLVALANHPSGK